MPREEIPAELQHARQRLERSIEETIGALDAFRVAFRQAMQVSEEHLRRDKGEIDL